MNDSASADWSTFEGNLGSVLSVLTEDQYLVISVKRGQGYVQFVAQGAWGMRVETVSENYLPLDDDLNHVQVAALTILGWATPTGTPGQANPRKQPGGSPNYFRDVAAPVPCRDVASLTTRTFREVWQIPHPGYLNYFAFDRDKRIILLPTLGLKHRE